MTRLLALLGKELRAFFGSPLVYFVGAVVLALSGYFFYTDLNAFITFGFGESIVEHLWQRLFNDMLGGGGTFSLTDYVDLQANNQLLDAEILTPYLLDAYANASAPGAPPELAALVADPRIEEAIGRLAGWDFSTPTGIAPYRARK